MSPWETVAAAASQNCRAALANTGRTQEEKTHFLRDCVNQGWPAASAFRLALSVATHLMQAAKVQIDAVLQLTASDVQTATVTQLDVQPSHLLLNDAGSPLPA